jgi:NAD(P)-dependent dehydrogenase (short-subunit alcohol dehydrogenase family)
MYQPFDLSGRSAVVTGGNGGIGYGMASALLAAGAKVAIWGSNPDKTEHARAQLAKECGDAARVHAFMCDVGDEAQVEAAFAQSASALGRVDACFANAGVSSKGTPLVEMSLDEWRRVQRVNVEGVFLTFRAAARHMMQHGQGGSLVATPAPPPWKARRATATTAHPKARSRPWCARWPWSWRATRSASTPSCRAGSLPT